MIGTGYGDADASTRRMSAPDGSHAPSFETRCGCALVDDNCCTSCYRGAVASALPVNPVGDVIVTGAHGNTRLCDVTQRVYSPYYGELAVQVETRIRCASCC